MEEKNIRLVSASEDGRRFSEGFIKQFNKEEQEKFWSQNEASYQGELISGITLCWARKYIGKNAIDVGAGSGALLKRFKEKYGNTKKITAIDIAPKDTEIKYGSCTNLPFENGTFDTVFCTDVIEHLSDSDVNKCLDEINRVLKINGHGVFTTNNNEKLNERIVICPECGCQFHRRGHCQIFNITTIRTLFCDKGFEVVKSKVANMGYLATFKGLARIFYVLRLHQLVKVDLLTSDLFFVVRKKKNI